MIHDIGTVVSHDVMISPLSFWSSKKMPPSPRVSPRCLIMKYSSAHCKVRYNNVDRGVGPVRDGSGRKLVHGSVDIVMAVGDGSGRKLIHE